MPLFRIEERALSIGLRLKRTSEREIGVPQLHGFEKPLLRRHGIPFGPLGAHDILGANLVHPSILTLLTLSRRSPNVSQGSRRRSALFRIDTLLPVCDNPAQMPLPYKHLVIVHGIGDQAPNETSINFMNNFLRALPQGKGFSLQVHNLITTVDPPEKDPQVIRPAYAEYTWPAGQCVIGFSEVFWQDITNDILTEFDMHPPVPMFVWAHSINTRFMGPNFYRARDTISNLESLLGIVDKLAVIFKRAGVFMSVLNRFVGDVQMYGESQDIRDRIDAHFAAVLARVGQDARDTAQDLGVELAPPEIFVVAHSEGTVVSYSSLVKAAIAQAPWLASVKALVTLGSPIDKHFGIWATRFLTRHEGVATLQPRIRWFNFWDISDPVGYGMKVLASNDGEPPTDAERIFDLRYDSGFARYPVPGAAHVAYWTDPAIHEQIIDQAMGLGTTRKSTDVGSRGVLKSVQPCGDWVAYFLARIVAVGLMLYFLTRLAGPIKPEHDFEFLVQEWPSYVLWLLGPLMLCKLLWEAYTLWGKIFLWLRGAVFIAWIGLLAMSALNLATPGPLLAKDAIGYATGLVVTILGWQLHTRVHKGLVQMWRYTKGVGTSACGVWHDPAREKARSTTASV